MENTEIGLAPELKRHSKNNSKNRNRALIGAALVLLLSGGYWYWQQGQQAAVADAPLIATVQMGSIENTIPSAGTLKPSRYVDVGAQVSGQLQQLHVEVGDVVEVGQLLVEIDARVQEAKVQGSRASIASQEAQLAARSAALELAKSNAARQERLRAENASSQLEFDNSVNSLAAAESSLIQLQKQIEQSRASLESDETQLEFSKLFAPAAGTVVSIDMIEGRTLNASQQSPTILRIADLGTMTVEADISEADIGSIVTGMDVYFTTLGGGARRWYGKLRQILPTPTVTNNVVLYTGLFDIENTDGSLLSEMTAQVYFITSAAQDVLTVPLGALTFQNAEGAGRRGPGGTPAVAGVDVAAGGPPAGAGRGRPAGAGGGGQGRGAGLAGDRPRGGGPGLPRQATVKVVAEDGSQEERAVTVGVSSRIAAEILSGLQTGEKVVAGIIQTQAAAAEAAPTVRIPGVGGPGGGGPGGGGPGGGGFQNFGGGR
jgi:macrolide-specific efflux system membrane fusion protein